MIKNMDYLKANLFAFYSINGNSFIDFMESSNLAFLESLYLQLKNKVFLIKKSFIITLN